MSTPQLGQIINNSKNIYELKDDESTLIKIVRKPTFESDPEMIKISQGHMNLGKIKECESYNLTHYIYIEKLIGYDLLEYITIKRLDSEKIRDIITQILEGLEYLHKHNIMHCDIKLENIFVCKTISNEDIIKIIDFDLSKKTDIKYSSYGGSYPYVSPEIFLKINKYSINEKADIWSLGILLYILVENKYPFISESDDDDYDSIMRERLTFLKENENRDDYNFELFFEIDERIWDPILLLMIKKMLIFDPEKRSVSTELLNMLYQVLNE